MYLKHVWTSVRKTEEWQYEVLKYDAIGCWKNKVKCQSNKWTDYGNNEREDEVCGYYQQKTVVTLNV